MDPLPSLNPFSVPVGAEVSLPIYFRSLDEVPRFGPSNSRGILLDGPPLDFVDNTDSLSVALLTFDTQLKLDLQEPTLTLLSNMPFLELCLFR